LQTAVFEVGGGLRFSWIIVTPQRTINKLECQVNRLKSRRSCRFFSAFNRLRNR